MNLSKFVAVSGLPGIYKMVSSRSNGMVVEHLASKKKEFVPSRTHQFTPLESISMFVTTEEDSLPLKDIFSNMLEKIETNPPVAANSDTKTLRAYFASVIPTYDPDRVMPHDIKKAIKWFTFLNDANALNLAEETTEEAAAEETTTEA